MFWKTAFETLISLALDACNTLPLIDVQFVKVVFLSIFTELPPVIIKTAPIDPLQFRKSEELIDIFDL